jgi:uncharacterized membrane protein
MSERLETTAAVEDRTLPAVCYALFILGIMPPHGVTAIIGLIIAYASRDHAGPKMYSHYTWLIRTFWISLAGFILGGCFLVVGIPLSIVLVGIPLVLVGGLLMGCAWVFMAVRLAIGLVYLARDEEYPRPFAIIA